MTIYWALRETAVIQKEDEMLLLAPLPRCRVEYHLSIVQCLRKVLNLNLIKTQVLTPSIQVIEEEELAKCHHLETDKSEMRGVLHHKLSGVEAQFHTATCSLWSSLHLLKLDP